MGASDRVETKSSKIRELGQAGVSVADIARQLNIRYQHARKVLLDANLLPGKRGSDAIKPKAEGPKSSPLTSKNQKPPLTVDLLLSCGFERHGSWKQADHGQIELDRTLPKNVGVYAFAKTGVVLYVGVATMGLAKRIYFYARPGKTQRTSLRLNQLVKDEIAGGSEIELYIASPDDLEWKGLPVHGSAGLELGLIKKFDLPWNKRSAK